MRRIGIPARPRYSRDLHVSDLNEGSAILIGGPGSDPWVSLFTDKLNFRWIEEPAARRRYFLNSKPAPGEQATYTSIYSWQGSDAVGYVDVALTQNPTHTGDVLLILGSDQQEAEAAANLLLRGTLPAEITALLERQDLRYFEMSFAESISPDRPTTRWNWSPTAPSDSIPPKQGRGAQSAWRDGVSRCLTL